MPRLLRCLVSNPSDPSARSKRDRAALITPEFGPPRPPPVRAAIRNRNREGSTSLIDHDHPRGLASRWQGGPLSGTSGHAVPIAHPGASTLAASGEPFGLQNPPAPEPGGRYASLRYVTSSSGRVRDGRSGIELLDARGPAPARHPGVTVSMAHWRPIPTRAGAWSGGLLATLQSSGDRASDGFSDRGR